MHKYTDNWHEVEINALVSKSSLDSWMQDNCVENFQVIAVAYKDEFYIWPKVLFKDREDFMLFSLTWTEV